MVNMREYVTVLYDVTNLHLAGGRTFLIADNYVYLLDTTDFVSIFGAV